MRKCGGCGGELPASRKLFCSWACRVNSTKKVTRVCEFDGCSREFTRYQSVVDNQRTGGQANPGRYCSQACYHSACRHARSRFIAGDMMP